MSRYTPLWEYVAMMDRDELTLAFRDIAATLGFSVDHAFLRFKKELTQYGFRVGKVSMRDQTVTFLRFFPEDGVPSGDDAG